MAVKKVCQVPTSRGLIDARSSSGLPQGPLTLQQKEDGSDGDIDTRGWDLMTMGSRIVLEESPVR